MPLMAVFVQNGLLDYSPCLSLVSGDTCQCSIGACKSFSNSCRGVCSVFAAHVRREAHGHLRHLSVEVRYKIQIHLSKEFTHAIDWLGQNMFKSSIKMSFLWSPSVALDYCFCIKSQWSISPIFVDLSQGELEPRNENKLIARCKRKRMVPENNYFRFI